MGDQKPERSSWFSVQRLFRFLQFPRRGSCSTWMGKELVDPETKEVVASCVIWAYGPVGAYLCAKGMMERLIPELPAEAQAVLRERGALEIDGLVGRFRQEAVGAGGEKKSRQGGAHGHDDAGDGRRGT